MTPTHEQVVFWMNPKRMRFLWDHIETVKGEPLGCWLWTGRDDREGYGVYPTRIEGKRVNIPVHRLMLILCYGMDWPEGLEAHHQVCKNRACVNPTHVLTSTHKEHTQDRKYGPRSAHGRIIEASHSMEGN